MYTPTPTLDTRSSKTSEGSSATSSDFCKTHKNSDLCQKPVNDNVLTILLSILLPVFAIACVLGYFLYRNYRKDKKESMEHDPDFDENGEATALPDFPELKAYPNQNPFNNNARYPMDHQFRTPQYQQQPPPPPQQQQQYDIYSQYSHEKQQFQDPYTFVLPYQHQTGSKVSLDDYARSLGDSQGYNTNPMNFDVSSNIHGKFNMPTSTPPRRSNLYIEHSRTPSDPVSPTKNKQAKQIYNLSSEDTPMIIPNIQDDSCSMSSLNFEKQPETKESIPQIIVQDEDDLKKLESNNDSQPDRSSSPFDTDSELGEKEMVKEVESRTTSPFEGANHVMNFPKEHGTEDTFDFSQSDRIVDDSYEIIKPPVTNMESENTSEVASDQEQENIKRMKSVYNVYFDPDVSGNEHEIPPLPQLQPRDYDNSRFSTTSSVYDNPPDLAHHHYQSYREYPSNRPQPRLPPLKPIPNASDIRKSTLETYTNYKPKVTSPPIRHYIPLESEMNESGYYSPTLPPQQQAPGPIPSATQAARNSVVMMDPATEITKSRTFKPAGSSIPQSPSMSFGETQFEHENGFIPGSRRSDVRRILNNH